MKSEGAMKRDEERGRQRVTLTPSAGQSQGSVDADIERSFAFGEWMADRGTQAWQSRFRRIGRLKVMVAKEVGPPPWRFPKVIFEVKAHPRPWLAVAVGWRSTAYKFFALVGGQGTGARSANGENE